MYINIRHCENIDTHEKYCALLDLDQELQLPYKWINDIMQFELSKRMC